MPRPPTACLPPLARLASYSTERIDEALQDLRTLYTKQPLPRLPSIQKALPKHLIHDTSVPDSGYASADEYDAAAEDGGDGDEAAELLEDLRCDPFEREYAIRWLTAFAVRSDAWVYDSAIPDEEDARAQLVDDAATLLASFAGSDDDDEEQALTREFTFKCAEGSVRVELNDAPLLTQDHTSVGLQSWGSAIVFADRMCADPAAFALAGDGLRVLELGAGTGLLSIAAAKLFTSRNPADIVATDYHPSVLDNLRLNVETNRTPVAVHALDWQNPRYAAPFDAPFDVILAADVIYHPEHAQWIKNCVEQLLVRPSGPADEGGVFWLIIPVRSTGRHEGMGSTVEAVFPSASVAEAPGAAGIQLAILSAEKIGKLGGIGRADESGYTLFRIGWVGA